jgi:hypothetical protein
MNLREYFEELRQIENALPKGNVVIVSLKTPDGGREGVRSEIDRELAAKLIVERRARQATDEEVAEYRKPRGKR